MGRGTGKDKRQNCVDWLLDSKAGIPRADRRFGFGYVVRSLLAYGVTPELDILRLQEVNHTESEIGMQ
jgi:hypothetical protein